MPILKNSRHERFAQLCASGKKGSAAYREVVNAKAKNPDGVENTYVISEILATGKLFLYVSKIGEEPVEAFLSAMANISNLVFAGKTKMTEQLITGIDHEDERATLSDFHRDYLVRYLEFELERQQKVSESFLKERLKLLAPQITYIFSSI